MKSGNFHSPALHCSLMLNICDYKTPPPNSFLPWFFVFCPLTQFQLGSIFHNDNMLNAKALLPLASPSGTSCLIIVHSTSCVTQACLGDHLNFSWLLVRFPHCSSLFLLLFSHSILKGSTTNQLWNLSSICLGPPLNSDWIKAIFLLWRTIR